MDKKIMFMGVSAILLMGLVYLVWDTGVLTSEREKVLKQSGYLKSFTFEGKGYNNFTYVSENRVRMYFNCTTNKEVFKYLLLTINDKEKHIRICEGRNRLVAYLEPGRYDIRINPAHPVVGSENASKWRLTIWEKILK